VVVMVVMVVMVVVKMIMMIVKFCNSVISGLSMATLHNTRVVGTFFVVLNFLVYIYLLFIPDVTFSYNFRSSQQTFLVFSG
jgi:hypothetical protein